MILRWLRRKRPRDPAVSELGEKPAGWPWPRPAGVYELSPAGAQEFAAGTIEPYDTSALHVGDLAIALVVGVPVDADQRLNELVAAHLAGVQDGLDHHARWATMHAPAPSVDGVPAMARLDLRFAAAGPRVEARFLFDLDFHGPDLWAAALTGRIVLVTAEAFDEMGTSGREVSRDQRALTIPDAGGQRALENALTQRMVNNPYTGSALG